VRLVKAASAGDFATARTIHYELMPAMRAMGLETNPIPVKAALALMGLIEDELRLPLTSLTAENREKLRAVLLASGLL